jgi:hypothetical protein
MLEKLGLSPSLYGESYRFFYTINHIKFYTFLLHKKKPDNLFSGFLRYIILLLF